MIIKSILITPFLLSLIFYAIGVDFDISVILTISILLTLFSLIYSGIKIVNIIRARDTLKNSYIYIVLTILYSCTTIYLYYVHMALNAFGELIRKLLNDFGA